MLLLWIPLRQKPGDRHDREHPARRHEHAGRALGRPARAGVRLQIGVLLGGILLVALASGLYIGARFGPGPRDGLMTGMNARLGWPIWVCRALVEVSVLVVGWLLGGTVGIGTVLFAVLIGPLVHVALPLLDTALALRSARHALGRRGRRADATRPVRGASVLAELRPVAAGVICECSALLAISIEG